LNVFVANTTAQITQQIPAVYARTQCNNTVCQPIKCAADITFLVETSQRVEPLVKQMLAVMESISAAMYPSYVGTQIALVTFSNNDYRTAVQFNLNNVDTQLEIVNFVNNLNIGNLIGISDLDAGLRKVNTTVFVNGQDRPDRPNIVVLIASGYYDPTTPDPFNSADALRKRTVYGNGMYAVEYGPQPARINLVKVVGDPTHVYTVADVNIVISRIKKVITDVCRAAM